MWSTCKPAHADSRLCLCWENVELLVHKHTWDGDVAISIFSWLFSFASRAASLYSANFSANWTQNIDVRMKLISFHPMLQFVLFSPDVCAWTHTDPCMRGHLWKQKKDREKLFPLTDQSRTGKRIQLPIMPHQKHELTRSVSDLRISMRFSHTHMQSKLRFPPRVFL